MPDRPPLFLLAFDHRQSLVRGLFGGDPDAAAARAPDVKLLVLSGLVAALESGQVPVEAEQVGVLVDDGFGARAAQAAGADGLSVAVAVEASGRREIALEHGPGFAAALEALDPAYAKVLVRYNPDDPPAMRERQCAVVRTVSDWCAAHRPGLLLELLVPPTDAQLRGSDGSTERFDVDQRPALVVGAMRELQAAGVVPSLWKLEGLEDATAARAVAAQALDGPHPAPCLVLGRGADDAKVDHWLGVAAGVPGFAGFAIGRSIWWAAVREWLDGSVDAEAARERIAAAYCRAIDVYLAAGALRT